jgi:hypothetical protein
MAVVYVLKPYAARMLWPTASEMWWRVFTIQRPWHPGLEKMRDLNVNGSFGCNISYFLPFFIHTDGTTGNVRFKIRLEFRYCGRPLNWSLHVVRYSIPFEMFTIQDGWSRRAVVVSTYHSQFAVDFKYLVGSYSSLLVAAARRNARKRQWRPIRLKSTKGQWQQIAVPKSAATVLNLLGVYIRLLTY